MALILERDVPCRAWLITDDSGQTVAIRDSEWQQFLSLIREMKVYMRKTHH